ncbi:ribonuclease P protein component [Methylonatrum kenyense]|uniref:ribonuclease P protein component n=1 Tax=Methylonatrum kenyense TaxID=455253 RepID=UPI0020BE07E1|nr:ribonuclease P protein component [Methylonatrum kenyense]
MRNRFPRDARLLRPSQFRRVFSSGPCRVSDDAFTLLAKGGEHEQPRLGMAISKRHVPRAVDRNRIKRISREAFRQQRMALPARDVILLARSPARRLDRAQLRRKLDALWQRLIKRCGDC